MSARLDPGGRLRAARPAVQGAPPPFDLVLARMAHGDRHGRATGGRRRRRLVLLAAVGALGLAAAAWGAVRVLSGAPVRAAYVPSKPTFGSGQPLAASLGVLPLRASDPSGGPAWAMRLIRTTRGLGCIQVGRLVNGQLGVLATDRYTFGGDGKFHPFLAADAIDGLGGTCRALDANGRVFLPWVWPIVTADGLATAGGNVPPGARVHCDMPGERNWGVRCPQPMLRELVAGFLGPDAVRIDVSAPGHSTTIIPYGPDGAYLLVLPAPAHANTGPYGLLGHLPPGTATLTISFRDGSSCRVPSSATRDGCVAKGFVAPLNPSPTAAQAHSMVHASYVRRLTGAPPALASIGESGFQSTPGGIQHGLGPIVVMPPGPALTVAFTARVPAPNLFTLYDVELHRAVVPGCFGGTVLLGQATGNTIRAGATVRFEIPLQPACHGTYTGRVIYASTPVTFDPSIGLEFDFLTALLGPRQHPLRIHVVTVGRFQVNVP